MIAKTTIRCACSAQLEVRDSGEVECRCGTCFIVSVTSPFREKARVVEQIKTPVVVSCDCGKHIMTIAKTVLIESMSLTCPSCGLRIKVVFA